MRPRGGKYGLPGGLRRPVDPGHQVAAQDFRAAGAVVREQGHVVGEGEGIGGVVLVGSSVEAEVYGPEAPADREVIEVYTPVRTPIVLQATQEPEPVYVYCNDGGKYYHSEECRYVKENTPKVTLSRALDAGYSRCPDCSAPDGMGY